MKIDATQLEIDDNAHNEALKRVVSYPLMPYNRFVLRYALEYILNKLEKYLH